MKRVAIIGGGAAGLAALRHLTAKPETYHCVLYEASDRVGGTWRYSPEISETERKRPIHGSMYQNLVTNLPKEVMAFAPEYQFGSKLPSFNVHENVQKYLENYAQDFGLLTFIKYNHYVEKVRRIEKKWSIETLSDGKKLTESFDAVFVCNGHYAKPYLPEVEGMEIFRGTIEHSKYYRTPDVYANKVVVLVGARASGQDISIDIAKEAEKVILSHNNPRLKTPLPRNIQQRLGIAKFTENGVVFLDGDEEHYVNHVIFCTGYEYDMPFLDESCGITIHEGRLAPLYKHLVNANNPTMVFIGICSIIAPFPHFDLQVRYSIAWLENLFEKPEKSAMLKWIHDDYEHKVVTLGLKHKYAHMLGDSQWTYADDLAKEAGIESIPKVVGRIYKHTWSDRNTNVLNYRTAEFKIENEKEYTYSPPIPLTNCLESVK